MFKGRVWPYNTYTRNPVDDGSASGTYSIDDRVAEIYTIDGDDITDTKMYFKYSIGEGTTGTIEIYRANLTGDPTGDPISSFPAEEWRSFTFDSDEKGFVILCATAGEINIQWEMKKRRHIEGDLIENPVDLIEYIKRMSNWSELWDYGIWGHDFVSNPEILIDTDAFDALRNHDEYKDLKVSRQIFNVSDGDTDKIVQELCEAFFLVSYSTADGLETISSLITPDLTPEPDIITYDKLRNNISNVEEAKTQDVFLNPEIKYAYDYATEEYKGHLKITNVDKATYNTEYSVNIGEPNGERIWDQCHKIWFRVKIIEPMPEKLVNQKWISDYYTAVWRLEKITEWMQKKRVSITVSWDIGRLWEIGTYIKLNHPHITGGEDLRCVIESWEGNKNSDSVTCKLVLIDEVMIPPLTVSYFQNTTEKILEKQDTPDLTNEGQLV